MFETHLSWVLVDQQYACEFKKALRLALADSTTLAPRRYFCKEELHLNRRCAPPLDRGRARPTGSVNQPCLNGRGCPIEYGVTMRAFAQDAIWRQRLEPTTLSRRLCAMASAAFTIAACLVSRVKSSLRK